MFCPQCSQQQVSSDVRFCSRCGFPLDGVAQLLASGGVVSATQPTAVEYGPPSPRLKGVRQGILLWLMGILLVPLLAVLVEEAKILPEAFAIFASVMFFVGGFVRIAYAFLLEDGPLRRKKIPVAPARPNAHTLDGRVQRDAASLPPAQSFPANAYTPPRADTSEIFQRPPSVTENTTRLLDDQEKR